jgi:hypothetical protein
LTIDESYNSIKSEKKQETTKTGSIKNDPVKTIILEADKLIKTLDEIKPESLNKESKKKIIFQTFKSL